MSTATKLDRRTTFGSTQAHLWIVALLFFGIGDVVSTSVGLGFEAIAEIGPSTAIIIEHFDVGGMIVVKLLVIGGFYLLWRASPRQYRIGIPIGLVLLGIAVTIWNVRLVIIVSAL